MARLWNGGACHVFLLQGNIHDLHPFSAGGKVDYVPLPAFLSNRLYAGRGMVLFFDVGEGLTFATQAMQTRFFAWLEVFDSVEKTNFHVDGPPRAFNELAPLLRRYFLHAAELKGAERGVTLVVQYPEKLVPAADEASASVAERLALVTLLKWAAAPELVRGDVGIVLLTESASELHDDLSQHPQIASVRIPLPDVAEREAFLASGWLDRQIAPRTLAELSDLSVGDLARRCAGLSLLRAAQLLLTSLRAGERVTPEVIGRGKQRLIEDYCQGLVRFKEPRPGVSLDHVATHAAAKARLRELAWLIRNQKEEVLERGVLVPGRVGVGKSFLIDCFAAECGLPVLELGEFRSKWVGETERQQARILLTIRALGPVIVVVDEADAVFGNRNADGDSGVSTRVFAAFAAHLGDSKLRGRELWIAMTSRPDLLAIDLRRQGRFGLCVPLFAAQGPAEVEELFTVVARVRRVKLDDATLAYIRETQGGRALTGSDVEAILVRAKERAVLAKRDDEVRVEDVRDAIESFIDPLDGNLLRLQELAAVLACTDRRFLPAAYLGADRGALTAEFEALKARSGRR